MQPLSVARRLHAYATGSLVGRSGDVRDITALLQEPGVQVVTVCGPGGVGKSRLAEDIACQQADTFPDGALLLPLSHITDRSLILPEIANALNLRGVDAPERLPGVWSTLHMLLVLDNLEQVIDAAADLAWLLASGGDSRVIVTSQIPLRIDDERVYRLEPLDVPPAVTDTDLDLTAYSSCQLFLQRAGAQDRTFLANLTAEDRRSIAALCRRLDGMPLPVELAASRMHILPPRVLLERLDRGIDVLASARRDVPDRLRSMENAVSWAYALLSDEEQRVFRMLSVFPSGFEIDVVERLCDAIGTTTSALDLLESLVERSMIRRVATTPRSRYAMLMVLRDVGLHLLYTHDECERAEHLLADWVMHLAETADVALTSPGQSTWYALLKHELGNIRHAVEWALKRNDPGLPVRVAGGMWRYFKNQGRSRECIAWLDAVLDRGAALNPGMRCEAQLVRAILLEYLHDTDRAQASADEALHLAIVLDRADAQARARIVAGALARDRNDLDASVALLNEAVAIAERHHLNRDLIDAVSNLAMIAYFRGDLSDAVGYWRANLPRLETIGDVSGIARHCSNLGACCNALATLDEAESYLNRSIALFRAMGDTFELCYPLVNAGEVEIGLGDLTAAEAYLTEALDIAATQGIAYAEAVTRFNLALVFLEQGDLVASARMVGQAVAACTSDAEARTICELGITLGCLLMRKGWMPEAARMLGASASFRTRIGHRPPVLRQRTLDSALAASRHVLGDAAWQTCMDEGAEWSLDVMRRRIAVLCRKVIGAGQGMVVSISSPDGREFPPLTARETDVVQLLIDGRGTKDIADQLHVSPRTVTTHIAHVLDKLGASSRAEIVSIALRHRLVGV